MVSWNTARPDTGSCWAEDTCANRACEPKRESTGSITPCLSKRAAAERRQVRSQIAGSLQR
jgi:hypothetical protein